MAELKPITRKEALLDNIGGGDNTITPVTREEQFLAAMAGEGTAPNPITRTEYFMAKAAEAGGGGGDNLITFSTAQVAQGGAATMTFSLNGDVKELGMFAGFLYSDVTMETGGAAFVRTPDIVSDGVYKIMVISRSSQGTIKQEGTAEIVDGSLRVSVNIIKFGAGPWRMFYEYAIG